jgi:hypothetical protein
VKDSGGEKRLAYALSWSGDLCDIGRGFVTLNADQVISPLAGIFCAMALR